MIREKVIAITLIIVSSIVLIESIAAWSTDHDLFLENSLRANRTHSMESLRIKIALQLRYKQIAGEKISSMIGATSIIVGSN